MRGGLAAVSGAADRLAVQGDRGAPADGLAAQPRPTAGQVVEEDRVQPLQGPADGGLAGHGVDAEPAAHRHGGVAGPLGEAGQAVAAAHQGGQGDDHDGPDLVADSSAGPGVGDLGHHVEQGHLGQQVGVDSTVNDRGR